MKELNECVENNNRMNRLFKHTEVFLDTKEGRQAIAEYLSSMLSPENLYGDGEIPKRLVKARLKLLTKAIKQLTSIDPTIIIS